MKKTKEKVFGEGFSDGGEVKRVIEGLVIRSRYRKLIFG